MCVLYREYRYRMQGVWFTMGYKRGRWKFKGIYDPYCTIFHEKPKHTLGEKKISLQCDGL
jgi:hypothetical protein